MSAYLRKRSLSRRALLRGAGVALSLPLLDSMFPAGVAYAQSEARPRTRLACLYMPHGAVMKYWTPAAEGKDFVLPRTLEPLEPHKQNINIISGFALPLAYGSGGASSDHARSSAVWLSGVQPVQEGQTRLGVTVDQVAAKAIGQGTPLPSLELCIEDGGLDCGAGGACALSNTISWRDDVTPLPMQNNPQVVFERLFGDGATDEERRSRRRQSQSLLDSVMDEASTLRRDLPGSDRALVERYLEDVREIERRIALAGAQIPDDLKLPTAPTGVPDDFDDHAKLMFDLQILAWQADITRVTTHLLAREASSITFPSSGIRDAFHPLSHHSNIEANIERLSMLNRYHVGVFAYMLEKLKTTPDGDGSLLDHSVVLYGSGMSNSNQHDHDPIPVILAGGASGRLEGGRHLRAAEPRETFSNVLLAMLEKVGVEQASFGDSTAPFTI